MADADPRLVLATPRPDGAIVGAMLVRRANAARHPLGDILVRLSAIDAPAVQGRRSTAELRLHSQG
jgi:hypothetical protein